MKYKVGDKVKIKSLEWYNQSKDEDGSIYLHDFGLSFVSQMSVFCGKTAIIKSDFGDSGYQIDIDKCKWTWMDWMLEDDFAENIVESKIFNESELVGIKANDEIIYDGKAYKDAIVGLDVAGGNDSTSINIKEVNEITFEDILTQMLSTYKAKNADYGSSFDKTLNEFGLVASVVRLNDKMERIKSLIKSDAKVLDEKIDDTLLDMANYAVLTLLWLRNKDSDIVSGTANDTENHSVTETKLPQEYSVGETFTDANGIKLKAVKSSICNDCYYRSLHSGDCTENSEVLQCVSFNRKDGEEVKFIKVD